MSTDETPAWRHWLLPAVLCVPALLFVVVHEHPAALGPILFGIPIVVAAAFIVWAAMTCA